MTMQIHVVRLYNLMSYDYTTSCCTTIPPYVVRHEDLIKKRRVCHKVSPLQFLGTDYTDYTDYTDFFKRDDNCFTYKHYKSV